MPDLLVTITSIAPLRLAAALSITLPSIDDPSGTYDLIVDQEVNAPDLIRAIATMMIDIANEREAANMNAIETES